MKCPYIRFLINILVPVKVSESLRLDAERYGEHAESILQMSNSAAINFLHPAALFHQIAGDSRMDIADKNSAFVDFSIRAYCMHQFTIFFH